MGSPWKQSRALTRTSVWVVFWEVIPWNRSKRFKRMRRGRRESYKMLSCHGQLELTSTGPLWRAMWIVPKIFPGGTQVRALIHVIASPMHTCSQVVHVDAWLASWKRWDREQELCSADEVKCCCTAPVCSWLQQRQMERKRWTSRMWGGDLRLRTTKY